jgi:uncharacterized membrane protein
MAERRFRKEAPLPFARSHWNHHWRFYVCLLLGLAVFLLTTDAPLTERILAGGDAFFVSYLAILMIVAARITPRELDRKADVEDEGIVVVILLSLILIGFCCFSVFEIFHQKDRPDDVALLLAIAGALLGWFMLHAMMAFHYANLFYFDPHGKGGGGLDFPDTEEPGAVDFLYFSFVLGMTAQVSDVQVTSSRIRRTTLGHSIVSFFFNTVLLAMAVNAVVSVAS